MSDTVTELQRLSAVVGVLCGLIADQNALLQQLLDQSPAAQPSSDTLAQIHRRIARIEYRQRAEYDLAGATIRQVARDVRTALALHSSDHAV